MIKKRIVHWLPVCIAILVAACVPKREKTYAIQGTFSGAANETLRVEMLSFPNINSAPSAVVLDTVTTDGEGAFAVTGIPGGPVILRIRLLQDPGYQVILSLNSDNTIVHADPNSSDMPEVKGSASNASFYGFIEASRNFKNAVLDKRSRIKAYRDAGNDSLATVAAAAYEAENKNYIDYIVHYADTAHSVANKIIAIESLQFSTHFAVIQTMAEQIFKTDTTSVYAKELRSKIERYAMFEESAPANSFIGKPAPDIEMRSPDGQVFSLSALKGRLVLLDFWASWCAPCRRENPNVVQVYDKYKDKGFTVFSVSLDVNRDAWMRAIANDKLDWPYHVSELNQWESSAASAYHVSGIPASFLIDKEGIIIAENLRGAALDHAVGEYLATH